jgi:hypothetical protein
MLDFSGPPQLCPLRRALGQFASDDPGFPKVYTGNGITDR